MTKIKICGITRDDDALLAAELGADFLGFIFVAGTPRFVAPERAAAIIAAVRDRGAGPKFAGVFRDSSPDYINEIVSVAGLDLVQLHGAETDADIAEIKVPAVKTLRVGDALPETHATPSAAWLLFDTYDDRRSGGTGRRFEWSLLANFDRAKPFFLAGGLTPETVALAISVARPDAIDVASGVESEPGIKDRAKLTRLFERVKRT